MNKYAGFWIRFWATLIDTFLIILIQMGVNMTFGLPLNPFDTSKEGSLAYNISQLLLFVIGILYDVIFWVNYEGATPGKKAMRIKVVLENGKNISYPQAIIRSLSYYISLIPFLLGFFAIGFDKKKQGWHDKIARTLVVYDK